MRRNVWFCVTLIAKYQTVQGSFDMLHFLQLEKIVEGKTIKVFQDRPITTLAIDSRKAVVNEGTLFFAIVGERNDGHQYINQLYNSGIKQFIVEHDIDLNLFVEANIIKVNSAVDALQAIA